MNANESRTWWIKNHKITANAGEITLNDIGKSLDELLVKLPADEPYDDDSTETADHFASTDELRQRYIEIREQLKNCDLKYVSNKESCQLFLQKVRKYFTKILASFPGLGENFERTISSMMTSENGIYSKSTHFLLELIQNADDALSEGILNDSGKDTKGKIDIYFDFSNKEGKIVTKYNERGFTPNNIVSLCSVGGDSKNNTEKIEIGEKGIGFKSVFGVAKIVSIKSGYFSFIYDVTKSMFIPQPDYKNFEYTPGTIITLYVNNKDCKSKFNDFYNELVNKDKLFISNPVLFLNTTSKIHVHSSDGRYVTLKNKHTDDSWGSKRKISISSDVTLEEQNQTDVIECYYYEKNIEFDYKMCKSRYERTRDEIPKCKKHKLKCFVIADEKSYEIVGKKGALYSFLPTEVQLNVPMAIHAPYELDLARDHVYKDGVLNIDGTVIENIREDNNAAPWFDHTTNELVYFLEEIYEDLKKKIKNRMTMYMPEKGNTFFHISKNDKDKVLKIDNLTGPLFPNNKLFYIQTSGNYSSIQELYAFPKNIEIEQQQNAVALMESNLPIFIPFKKTDMREFGCTEDHILKNYLEILFKKAINENTTKDLANQLFTHLENYSKESDFSSFIKQEVMIGPIGIKRLAIYNNFTQHLNVSIKNAIYDKNQTEHNNAIGIDVYSELPKLNDSKKELLDKLILSTNNGFKNTYQNIKQNVYILDIKNIDQDGFSILFRNGIVVSKQKSLIAIAKIAEQYGIEKFISAKLYFDQLGFDLDESESFSNEEFFDILVNSREMIRERANNDGMYTKLLIESRKHELTFIDELIQNADDCKFNNIKEKEIPTFTIDLKDNHLITTLNEDGFINKDVRAITSIGNSTKSALYKGETIGNKGIGFKYIFSRTKKVVIHSGNFDFSLEDSMPTLPHQEFKEKYIGTKMLFEPKNNDSFKDFEDEDYAYEIIKKCICLRKLKKIIFLGKTISILDTSEYGKMVRTITYNNKVFKWIKLTHHFQVPQNIVASITDEPLPPKSKQHITILVPSEETDKNLKNNHRIYSGLPTAIGCNIPIIIDIPFYLDTSREKPQESKTIWNGFISEQIKHSLCKLINEFKDEGLAVLRFVKNTGANYFNNDYLNKTVVSLNDFILKYISSVNFIPTLSNSSLKSANNKIPLKIVNKYYFSLDKEDLNIVDYCNNFHIIRTVDKNTNKEIDREWMSILYKINCVEAIVSDLKECIAAIASIIRKKPKLSLPFYDYLLELRDTDRIDILQNQKIIPIVDGSCIKLTCNIRYIEDNLSSKDVIKNTDYIILDENIMDHKICQKLLEKTEYECSALSTMIIDREYIQELINKITDCDDKEGAIHLLTEFKKNKEKFINHSGLLMNNINELPMKFINEHYCRGSKFISSNNIVTKGELLGFFVVHDDYCELAKLIGCKDISTVSYSELDEFGDEPFIKLYDIYDLFNEKNNIENCVSIMNKAYAMNKIEFIIKLKSINSESSDEKIKFAKYLLNKYNNEKEVFSFVINKLFEINKNITVSLPTVNGTIGTELYISPNGEEPNSEWLKNLIVKNEYADLAKKFKFKSIDNLSFESIKKYGKPLNTDNIIDLQRMMKEDAFTKIMKHLKDNEMLTITNDLTKEMPKDIMPQMCKRYVWFMRKYPKSMMTIFKVLELVSKDEYMGGY